MNKDQILEDIKIISEGISNESVRDYLLMIMCCDVTLCSDDEIADHIMITNDEQAIEWLRLTAIYITHLA